MAFKVIIKEEAQADITDAYVYYEQLLTGLGDRFIQAVLSRLEQLSQQPYLYSYVAKGKEYRDILVDGFPYLVIYEIDNDEVLVYMVHNTHKKPRF